MRNSFPLKILSILRHENIATTNWRARCGDFGPLISAAGIGNRQVDREAYELRFGAITDDEIAAAYIAYEKANAERREKVYARAAAKSQPHQPSPGGANLKAPPSDTPS